MPMSLRTAEPSDEELEVVEAVAMRSISWLGRVPVGGVRARAASSSSRTISRSASFILAIEVAFDLIEREARVSRGEDNNKRV